MPEYVPAPSYPNYAGFLSNLIGNLPSDYRSAQLQQGAVDVQNAFKGGVPTNPDGTPNYAAALQTLAKAGDPGAVAALGPAAQQQTWQQQGQAPPALLGGGGAPPAPSAPQPAPTQPPAAPPPQAPSGAIAGTVSDGSGPPPTLAAMVSAVAPDPAKSAAVTGMLAKILGVDPNVPLTPDQVGRAQRIMANLAKPSVGGPAMGDPAPPQSGFAGRLNVPPDPAVAGARAVAAPVGTPQPAAARDIASRETVAYGGPQRLLTGAEATAIATGNAPGTGGAPGTPFGLPPAADAVWGRMVSQESRDRQFNADGSVVTSPKGAVGIAQVMPETGPAAAKLAGLPWDPTRFKNDPNYNLALGRAYYAQQVQAFGSPDVAAAAYNAGPRAVLSAQAKATNRGGGYLDYLPAETRDYVAKVMGSGGAPVAQGAQGGDPQQGGRPIFPQPPLPPGFSPGQEPQAIEALRNEALKYARIPGGAGQATATRLNQYAEEIEKAIQPREVRQGQSFVDAYGRTVYTAPLPGATFDDETIRQMAQQARAGDTSVFQNIGRGVQGPQNIVKLRQEITRQNEEAGDTGSDQAMRNAEFFGVKSGERTLGTKQANIEMAATEFKNVIPVVRAASLKVQRTNYPDLNAIVQAGEKHTGDPNIVAFGSGVNTLVNLYARAISPSGTPTVSDKEHAREILSAAWSQGQFDAAVSMMQQEIDAALNSPEKVRADMRRRFGGAPADDAAPPTGTPAQGATGGGSSGGLPSGWSVTIEK